MLQWFIKEQVEERKERQPHPGTNSRWWVDKGSSLVMLDHRIGKRGE